MSIIRGTYPSTYSAITWTANQSQSIAMGAHNGLRIVTNGSTNAAHTLSLQGTMTSSGFRKMYQTNSTKLISVAVTTGGGSFQFAAAAPVVRIVRSSSLLGTTGKFQRVVL